MQNKITISEKIALLESAIYERERVALDGLDRLTFTAKCFIVLECLGLGLVIGSLSWILTA